MQPGAFWSLFRKLFIQIIKEGFADASENAFLAVMGVIPQAQLVAGHDAFVGLGIEDLEAEAYGGGVDGLGGMLDGDGDGVFFADFLAVYGFGAVGGLPLPGGVAGLDVGIVMPLEQRCLDVDVCGPLGVVRGENLGFFCCEVFVFGTLGVFLIILLQGQLQKVGLEFAFIRQFDIADDGALYLGKVIVLVCPVRLFRRRGGGREQQETKGQQQAGAEEFGHIHGGTSLRVYSHTIAMMVTSTGEAANPVSAKKMVCCGWQQTIFSR